MGGGGGGGGGEEVKESEETKQFILQVSISCLYRAHECVCAVCRCVCVCVAYLFVYDVDISVARVKTCWNPRVKTSRVKTESLDVKISHL